MTNLNVSEVISKAWDFTKEHWLKMLLINIFVGIVTSIVACVLTIPDGYFSAIADAVNGNNNAINHLQSMAEQQNYKMSLLSGLISAIIELGVINAVLLVVLGKTESPSLTKGYATTAYFKYILATILYDIIIIIGLCLCIVPGIYFASRLIMYKYILLDDSSVGVIDALQKSWNMTKDNVLNIILIAVLCVLINIVGVLCCCVGVLITATISYFAWAICYKKLSDMQQETVASEI